LSPGALEVFLFGTTLLFYFLSSVAHHIHLFAGSERARRVAPLLLAAAVVVHTAALGVWCTTHEWSILRDPGMPFSIVAYFLAVVQLAGDFCRGWAALGSLSVPLAFVAQFYASAVTPGSMVQAPPGGGLLSPHVMAILLAFSAFTLAFCLAVIYLVQSRLLKTKQIKGFFKRLPPLESVSNAAHWLAVVGFSMLTLGVITGAIAAPHRWGAAWYLDPRTLTSLVAWTIYAAYLTVSMLMGWRGRRTTYFLIAGFLVVLVAFVFSVALPKHPGVGTGVGGVGSMGSVGSVGGMGGMGSGKRYLPYLSYLPYSLHSSLALDTRKC
jgi:ABC-type uncharacterized transport system permease subunit